MVSGCVALCGVAVVIGFVAMAVSMWSGGGEFDAVIALWFAADDELGRCVAAADGLDADALAEL